MLHRISRLLVKLTQFSDILLVIGVVGIIAMMILPLPTFIVDFLLASNLCIAVSLVMMSMYIRRPLQFSSFPTVLLLSTLLRLGMNITTTRLVLIQANAGEVIETFGKFVVAGNLIVGAVIFLIVTILQFLVIAKGAERVAEVAARFTLDAMPGKQMSIDADMRAGAIDLEEAKRRRYEVETTNQLFGAMDGAMKFVKGDAIAGIIIVVVNILGGIAVGMLQKGMDLSEALQRYSILTIGDGLVSQIPSLMIAITAGIIVTRVAGEDSPALGQEISQQVLAQPKAILVAGIMLLLFALIPGFPKPQFLAIGGVVATIGFVLIRSPEPAATVSGTKTHSGTKVALSGPEDAPHRGRREQFTATAPLSIMISSGLKNGLNLTALEHKLDEVSEAIFMDLGVLVPTTQLTFSTAFSSQSEYRILVQEVPVASGDLRTGWVIARDKARQLEVSGIEFETAPQFLPDVECNWVRRDSAKKLADLGIASMNNEEIIGYHLACVMRQYAGSMIGMQETKQILDQVETQFAELSREVQRVVPIQRLAQIFSRLVEEGISIRNLRTILETVIEWGPREKDTVVLVEYVRAALKQYISYRFSGGQNLLPSYVLTPAVEENIRKSLRQSSSGNYLAMNARDRQAFIEATQQVIGDLTDATRKPVILTSMDIRRYVKKLVETVYPDIPVLSYQELTEQITTQPLGKIDPGPISSAA